MRLRQTAGMAVVFVAISLAIVFLTHLVHLARMLQYLGRGISSFYAASAALSLVDCVLIGSSVLIVFKSLGRDREKLLRDEPSEPPVIDAAANGGCTKLKCAAVVVMLLVLISLIMGVAMSLLEMWHMKRQYQGSVDVFFLLTRLMGFVGGILLDVGLLMVLVSLLRIKEPPLQNEPEL